MHTFFQLILHHEMLNIGRVTIVKVLFPVLVHIFNIDLFEFSAAILEKGLLQIQRLQAPVILDLCLKKTRACAGKPYDDREVDIFENLRSKIVFGPLQTVNPAFLQISLVLRAFSKSSVFVTG